MAILNSIVQDKLRVLLEEVELLTAEDFVEERDLLDKIVTDVSDIIQTGGLPQLHIKEITNPVDTPISSEYLDDIQKQLIASFLIYDRMLQDMSAKLNVLVTKIGDRLEEKIELTTMQKQEIVNLRTLAINAKNNVSILGEMVIQHETLRNSNVRTRDCNITQNGSITLPQNGSLRLDYTADIISELVFRVASPRAAQNALSYSDNVNGKSNNAAITPGHFQGKLLGRIDKPNDIRLVSQLNELFDGKDDTVWECEYVTDTPVSSSFVVVVNIRFNKNVWINWIKIKSDNDIQISWVNDINENEVITDYENEAASLVFTNNLVLTMTQNQYNKLEYTLDAIIRNGYNLHTYNSFETYHNLLREQLSSALPDVTIKPVKEIEQHAGENDVVQIIKDDKFRYDVAISDMELARVTYNNTGVYETEDIIVPRADIYAVELETSTFYPNPDIDGLQYWLSFDKGESWTRIRSKSESVTLFTNKLKTRITLSDTEQTDTNTEVLNITSDRVRIRVDLLSADQLTTPVLHWYKLRIKLKAEASE